MVLWPYIPVLRIYHHPGNKYTAVHIVEVYGYFINITILWSSLCFHFSKLLVSGMYHPKFPIPHFKEGWCIPDSFFWLHHSVHIRQMLQIRTLSLHIPAILMLLTFLKWAVMRGLYFLIQVSAQVQNIARSCREGSNAPIMQWMCWMSFEIWSQK